LIDADGATPVSRGAVFGAVAKRRLPDAVVCERDAVRRIGGVVATLFARRAWSREARDTVVGSGHADATRTRLSRRAWLAAIAPEARVV